MRAALGKASTYLENSALPTGSGLTEAACKHIIKEHVCDGGMKWELQSVLSLRLPARKLQPLEAVLDTY